MARQLRIQYEGAWYHIMNRGLERKNIFLKNKHKKLFTDLLQEISERFQIDIHSYCLMDNHYHLLLQTQLPNLDLAMKHLSSLYTLKFNRDVKRDGPLFRGRYKSILIDKDNYLLNVSRYIHKNPSTAKIIENDQKYPWSSYQYYNLNINQNPAWLITKEILSYFNDDRRKYVSFVEVSLEDAMDNTIKFYASKKLKPILGSDSFVKEISRRFFNNDDPSKLISNRDQIIRVKYPSLEELLLIVSERYQVDKNIILNNSARNYVFARSLLIYLFMLNPRFNLTEKGKFLGVSHGAISKNYTRFLERLKLNKNMREEVELVRNEIYF